MIDKKSNVDNKKSYMTHLQDYTERVYIIDNDHEEIAPLETLLRRLDIDVTVYNPEENNEITELRKNRQLFFVDLMLDENSNNAKSNISRLVGIISKLIPENFGPYGIVAWTKHEDYMKLLINDIKEALTQDVQADESEENLVNDESLVLETAPMFVVSVDKTKYLKNNSYEGLLDDIENALKGSLPGYFFMTWNASVKNATTETINKIFDISDDFFKRDDQIESLIHTLGQNHTGYHENNTYLSVDCYKSFDEILFGNLYIQQKEENNLQFRQDLENQWNKETKDLIEAKLNTLLFIDTNAISQEIIVPGNVYKLTADTLDNAISTTEKVDTSGYSVIYIAIELTPPCDFSNKKAISRIIHGFLLEKTDRIDEKKWEKKARELNMAEYRYVLKNVFIKNQIQILVLDYKYLYTPKDEDLKDNTKYEIFFRVKPKLFADILSRFASHASRLGLSDIRL